MFPLMPHNRDFTRRGAGMFLFCLHCLLKINENWRRSTFLPPPRPPPPILTSTSTPRSVSVLFHCRWATRTLARWNSWWTNMASTTLSKSTPGSRLSTRSPKKSLSKQMFSICIRLRAGRRAGGQLDFCRACPRGSRLVSSSVYTPGVAAIAPE